MNIANETMDRQVLERLVRESHLAVGLVDLTRLRLVAGSPRAGAALGLCEVIDVDIFSLVPSDDVTQSVLGLMRSGSLDAYEARRVFIRPDGEEQLMLLWVRGLATHGFGLWALVEFKTIEGPDVASAPTRTPAAARRPTAIATSDDAGIVDHLSGEIERLLATTSESLRTAPLSSWVHPSDAEVFRAAMRRSHVEGVPQATTVRLKTADGGWALFRVIVKVGDVALGSRVGVAVLPQCEGGEDDESGVDTLVGEIRALDLVDAMTYLPAAAQLPALVEDLSEREWEIVARLLRGDRAPAIARALYLAPSTVRNHLTAVFRKLGVHSQQELISCFRGPQ